MRARQRFRRRGGCPGRHWPIVSQEGPLGRVGPPTGRRLAQTLGWVGEPSEAMQSLEADVLSCATAAPAICVRSLLPTPLGWPNSVSCRPSPVSPLLGAYPELSERDVGRLRPRRLRQPAGVGRHPTRRDRRCRPVRQDRCPQCGDHLHDTATTRAAALVGACRALGGGGARGQWTTASPRCCPPTSA